MPAFRGGEYGLCCCYVGLQIVIALQAFNLAGFTVGQQGFIDLSSVLGGGGVNFSIGISPTVRLHNDSGCGLIISLPSSASTFNLPAGGWVDCNPSVGETKIAFTVVYVLPTPPVSLLMATLYMPSEPIPAMTVLGNSPIGGGINTNVTTTQTISNLTNLPGINWLEVSPTDTVSTLIYSDTSGNLVWNSDNAGLNTVLLQLVAGANPQTILGAVVLLSNGKLGMVAAGDIIDASGADTSLKVRGATNAIHLQSPAGTDVATFAYNQITFNQGLKMANGHIIQFNIGQIKDLNQGSALSGTINHGLTGVPASVLACCNSSGLSATVGASNYTSTQFTLTIGGGLSGQWTAYR